MQATEAEEHGLNRCVPSSWLPWGSLSTTTTSVSVRYRYLSTLRDSGDILWNYAARLLQQTAAQYCY